MNDALERPRNKRILNIQFVLTTGGKVEAGVQAKL
jgi:hypothetical protein